MVKICPNCGFKNQDSYNFCANCGKDLFLKNHNEISIDSKNLIIISYILTIAFSWGGLILNLLLNFSNFGFFSFFGVFLLFYLIQSNDPNIKKHGYIQIAISLIGIILSINYLL